MPIYVINGKRTIKWIKLISVFLLLIFVAFEIANILERNYVSTSVTADTGRVIIIDAGHGGEDSGAIGVNGAYEKDLNLNRFSPLLGIYSFSALWNSWFNIKTK